MERSSTAILRVLRSGRDEAQLTQVIAAVASDDDEVAGELARLLVRATPEENGKQREALGPVPSTLRCRPEATLRSSAGQRHGRVDLRFDDETREFTLLAELKLHSGYGEEQIQRYQSALNELPTGRRSGLLAVTRNVPGAGEPAADTPHWLGSLRWTEIYDGLLNLPIKDKELRSQWRLLLSVIEEEEDFGVKELELKELEGWAAYLRTREKLERLIEDVAPKALEHLRELLVERDAWAGTPKEGTADLLKRGNENKVPYPTQTTVQARFFVPAAGGHERVRIQFLGGFDKPYFTIEARRYGASTLLARKADGHEKFGQAVNWLTKPPRDFVTDERHYVSHVRSLDRGLDGHGNKTIGEALLDLIKEDLDALVQSGILDPDSGFPVDIGPADETDEKPVDEG